MKTSIAVELGINTHDRVLQSEQVTKSIENLQRICKQFREMKTSIKVTNLYEDKETRVSKNKVLHKSSTVCQSVPLTLKITAWSNLAGYFSRSSLSRLQERETCRCRHRSCGDLDFAQGRHGLCISGSSAPSRYFGEHPSPEYEKLCAP